MRTDVQIGSNQNDASVVRVDLIALGEFTELVRHRVILVETRRPGRRDKHGLHLVTEAVYGSRRGTARQVNIGWSARARHQQQCETGMAQDVIESLAWIDSQLCIGRPVSCSWSSHSPPAARRRCLDSCAPSPKSDPLCGPAIRADG